MTGADEPTLEYGQRASVPSALARERRDHAASVLAATLEKRDATAFVHAGLERDPAIRYSCESLPHGRTAVAYDGTADEWLVRSTDVSDGHPAADLATTLTGRGCEGTILTPPHVPHDAALYLENAGFEVASTDAIARARATKTAGERDRIAAAQRAASAGIRRAASVLADATVVDGRLAVADEDGDTVPLTPARLRIAIDEAIVGAGAFPAGNTAVNPGLSHTSIPTPMVQRSGPTSRSYSQPHPAGRPATTGGSSGRSSSTATAARNGASTSPSPSRFAPRDRC